MCAAILTPAAWELACRSSVTLTHPGCCVINTHCLTSSSLHLSHAWEPKWPPAGRLPDSFWCQLCVSDSLTLPKTNLLPPDSMPQCVFFPPDWITALFPLPLSLQQMSHVIANSTIATPHPPLNSTPSTSQLLNNARKPMTESMTSSKSAGRTTLLSWIGT